jgi:sugar phosphate isomerase/epimerase
MNIKRSIALSVLFPRSRHEAPAFARALSFLAEWPLDSVEFYYEGTDRGAVAAALADSGLQGIYIAVIPLKGQDLSLCSPDEDHRSAACELTHRCIDEAYELGCRSVMINSGRHPGAALADAAIDQFVCSVTELQEHAGRYGINLLLEPCDSQMDARNLLGPTQLSAAVARRLRRTIPDFALTLDTAHIREEGEDFLTEVSRATDCCDHLHFANCVVDDPSDPMYGDKHVGFDYPGSAFPPAELRRIFDALQTVYHNRDCRIALEILCREPDPERYFRKLADQIPWFFY